MPIRGMARAEQQFLALPVVVQQRTTDALTQSAAYVADRARGFCPVDHGDLRSAITFVVQGLRAIIGIEQRRFDRGGRNSAHQWPSIYGPWVEFGHWAGTVAKRFVAGRPFMRPAADVGRVQFPQQMEKIGPQIEQDLARTA